MPKECICVKIDKEEEAKIISLLQGHWELREKKECDGKIKLYFYRDIGATDEFNDLPSSDKKDNSHGKYEDSDDSSRRIDPYLFD